MDRFGDGSRADDVSDHQDERLVAGQLKALGGVARQRLWRAARLAMRPIDGGRLVASASQELDDAIAVRRSRQFDGERLFGVVQIDGPVEHPIFPIEERPNRGQALLAT